MYEECTVRKIQKCSSDRVAPFSNCRMINRGAPPLWRPWSFWMDLTHRSLALSRVPKSSKTYWYPSPWIRWVQPLTLLDRSIFYQRLWGQPDRAGTCLWNLFGSNPCTRSHHTTTYSSNTSICLFTTACESISLTTTRRIWRTSLSWHNPYLSYWEASVNVHPSRQILTCENGILLRSVLEHSDYSSLRHIILFS